MSKNSHISVPQVGAKSYNTSSKERNGIEKLREPQGKGARNEDTMCGKSHQQVYTSMCTNNIELGAQPSNLE